MFHGEQTQRSEGRAQACLRYAEPQGCQDHEVGLTIKRKTKK